MLHFVAMEMGLLSRREMFLGQAAKWNPDGRESVLHSELF